MSTLKITDEMLEALKEGKRVEVIDSCYGKDGHNGSIHIHPPISGEPEPYGVIILD